MKFRLKLNFRIPHHTTFSLVYWTWLVEEMVFLTICFLNAATVRKIVLYYVER